MVRPPRGLKSFAQLKRLPRVGEKVVYVDGGMDVVKITDITRIAQDMSNWFPIDQTTDEDLTRVGTGQCPDCRYFKSGCPYCRSRGRGF